MKKSIFARTFSAIVITVAIILIVSYAVISFFAQNLYYGSKMNHAAEVAAEANSLYNDSDQGYSELIYGLDDLSIQAGGRIVVVDKDGSVVYGGRAGMGSQMNLNYLPDEALELKKGETAIFEIAENTGPVSQYVYAERFSTGLLIMIGIRIDSIKEAVDVLKRIMMIVMVAASIISVYAAYYLSRSISVPLVRLNVLASEIGKLNFDAKYEGNREDEIGELGRTLNDLSQKLENNIEGLQGELEKEKNLQVLRRQFTAQASHEMQTPIAIIKSYLEAIEDGMVEDETEREQYFKVIRDETDKMSSMVRSMLDLSQIESGTFTIKRTEFDIYGLLEVACDKFFTLAETQGIEFQHSEIPHSCFMIYGDELRLEQVIANFVSNAYKHAKNSRRVVLEFQELKEADMIQLPRGAYRNGIRISVWNDGDAIRDEDMPYLWESFYKAQTLTGQKGTGLGLSIARSILQMHDYAYGVQNVEGGVEFWFEAPGNRE